MSPIVRWLMAIAMVGPVVAADPVASVQLAEDDDAAVMVVPRADQRYAMNAVFMQMTGTGAAWDRDSGTITVKVPDETDKGFDLVDELKTSTLGVGFTADQVAGYVKEAQARRIDGAHVSTITIYPLDHSAKVVMSEIDVKAYAVIRITLVGRTADKVIGFYKVVGDVSER